MSFFSTPLSGLNASSFALQAISNNLANLNTNGYKSQDVSFSDVFYQNNGTNGSGDPIQSGLGVQVNGTTQNLTNGNVASTGIDSNMALQGGGFFVTQGTLGANGYTRAGDFTVNNAGQITSLSGQLLLGYPAVAGVVSTTSGLQPINVGASNTNPAQPTTNFSLTTNLDATAAVGDTHNTPIGVYDSLGALHNVTVSFTKTATNAWSYNVTIPSTDIQGGTGTSTSVGSGSLVFDSNGNLTSPTGSITGISIGPLANGASTMTPTWKLDDASGNPVLRQTATASSDNAQSQDGYAAGSLTKYAILADGSVQATFSDGQTRTIAQVAIANFANPEGLALAGNSTYSVTEGSGPAVMGIAGNGGRGVIKGDAVEQSNVDVASEFAKMIVAQRSYEANAKSITAFDQIEQATIAMKS